jgi:hypothetical protein
VLLPVALWQLRPASAPSDTEWFRIDASETEEGKSILDQSMITSYVI